MEIKIMNSEELSLLFDALAKDIVDAEIYYRLFCDLLEAKQAYPQTFNQAPTFWFLTLTSLNDAWISRLCRVYDQENSSLSLYNLLDIIKAHPHLFLKESFRERLQNNPYVDSLAQDARVPQIEQIEKDIQISSPQDPIVKKLIKWRGNYIAHRGVKPTLNNFQILRDNPLSTEEIKLLLNQSRIIINKYLFFFRATTWSAQIIGHDDYKSLLKFINLGLKTWGEDIEKQIAQLGNAFVDGAGV
jgi:hypothetical protein